jgi:hypothetical protein
MASQFDPESGARTVTWWLEFQSPWSPMTGSSQFSVHGVCRSSVTLDERGTGPPSSAQLVL